MVNDFIDLFIADIDPPSSYTPRDAFRRTMFWHNVANEEWWWHSPSRGWDVLIRDPPRSEYTFVRRNIKLCADIREIMGYE